MGEKRQQPRAKPGRVGDPAADPKGTTVWDAIGSLRWARLYFHGPTQARPESVGTSTTWDLTSNTVIRRQPVKRPGRPARPARVSGSLYGHEGTAVKVVMRKGETIEATIWRCLAEIAKRELDGMPKPSPAGVEARRRRKLLLSADTKPM